MTSVLSKSFKTQRTATYQPFEECHWTVVTSPGKNIRFTIDAMDIKNSINNTENNKSDKCTGDYLEVSLRDLMSSKNTDSNIAACVNIC